MNTTTHEALTHEAEVILKERGGSWGTFIDFVQDSSAIKDDFRMFFKNIDDMKKLEFYRLRNFIEEMLALKLTRAAYVVKQMRCANYDNEALRDCAIDFLNYCTLCETQFKFELRFKTLHAEKDWLLFFNKVLKIIVFGEESENETN